MELRRPAHETHFRHGLWFRQTACRIKMGALALTWKTLCAQSWFFSPKLETWQKKILADLRERVPREKNVFWILSSGTQSLKSVKAIGLSRESVLCSAEAVNRHLHGTSKDRWLLAIPHYHIG